MRWKATLAVPVLLTAIGTGIVVWAVLTRPGRTVQEQCGPPGTSDTTQRRTPRDRTETYTVERTEYNDPPPQADDPLADDTLDEKRPAFDETVVDSRPLGDWEVNASAAVIRLHCPALRPDVDDHLLVLRPSYSEAIRRAEATGHFLLPSANLVDAAAKQFDDGLYAAIDLACYRGEIGPGPAAPELVQAVFGKLPPGSPARPFLAAALELARRKVPLDANEEQEKLRLLRQFDADKVHSKPIGFYTWTPELLQVWRFYRFLQQEFGEDNLESPRAMATALEANADLLKQYRVVNGLFGRLTNPLSCLPADALIGMTGNLRSIASQRGARRPTVAFFPPSTSRETELFNGLTIAPGNLMAEFIRSVRSGEIDLKPGEKDGWYQYQAYALETMLLPTLGQEREKLLLTAQYKKRLIEAFEALVSKRRETHVRQLEIGATATAPGPELLRMHEQIPPRLRIEPCPTFYLRTARAYTFVQDLLLATAGKERLEELHGLRQGGTRGPTLASELEAVRQRFYGFYLVSCEDIGMKPALLKVEPVDQDGAKTAALAWLDRVEKQADLSCDARVAVPICVGDHGPTTLWATLGVRLALLEAEYARPPKVRSKEKGGTWQDVESEQLGSASYVIPVDEFAEFELRGSNALTREELRALCDQHKTKAEILKAVSTKK